MFLFESLMKLHPSADILARIDSIYHVTTYTNYEVLFDWCRLSVFFILGWVITIDFLWIFNDSPIHSTLFGDDWKNEICIFW